MNVCKFYNNQDLESDNYRNYFRDMQMLVTDTVNRKEPKYLAYTITGYYDTLVNNTLFDPRTDISVTPLIKDEMRLFYLIDSLAIQNNIKYIQIDTSKILGWFRYIF